MHEESLKKFSLGYVEYVCLVCLPEKKQQMSHAMTT